MSSRNHAVVIGASMSGLLAARILADHFERVTLFERDLITDNQQVRKGVPQGNHSHALLARGYQVLAQLFPDFVKDVVHLGAIISDVRDRYDFYYRGYWPHGKTNMIFVGISRPALEHLIRSYVQALSNVHIEDSVDVEGLVLNPIKTTAQGIIIKPKSLEESSIVTADLIVDASGRGSQMPLWLKDLGFVAPDESIVNVNIKYASCYYQRSVAAHQARASLVVHDAPHLTRAGCIIPIEGQRYTVTVADMFGRDVPKYHADFKEFARSLAAPDIYNLISKEQPLDEIRVYNFPKSVWRHYEKLKNFPQGLVVIGDAFSSFNPIYGQGMTVAALDAIALDSWLKQKQREVKPLFNAMAQNVEMAWGISVGADFAFPQTTGTKAIGTNLLNNYFALLTRAAPHNFSITKAFFAVNQLMNKPISLLHPQVVYQVLKNSRQKQKYFENALRPADEQRE